MKYALLSYMEIGWVRLGAGAFTLLALLAACGDPGKKVLTDGADEGAGAAEEVESTGSGTEEEEPLVCPHEGEPLVDVSSFEPCGFCGGGHCVPTTLLPEESAAKFDNCDADNKCVPDEILETKGQFIPTSCTSALGAEGRCISRCISDVEAKADSLPQDVCTDDQLCVPCFDPFSGESTGACEKGCDPGPAEPPMQLPTCCSGVGVCLPSSELGDKADDLGQDVCPQNGGEALCVPSAFLDPTFSPQTCVDGNLFGKDGPGVCLPTCLPAVQGLLSSLFLDQEGCLPGELCAPCDHPLTGDPTGACDL